MPEFRRRMRSRRAVDILACPRRALGFFALRAFRLILVGQGSNNYWKRGPDFGRLPWSGARARRTSARAIDAALAAMGAAMPFCVTLIRRQAEPWVAVAISITPWSSFFPLGNSRLPVPGLYILREGECWSSRREGEVRRDIIERSPASGRASSEPYPTKFVKASLKLKCSLIN